MIFAQVPLFPEQASTLAEEVDGLFFYILAVTIFFTVLIAGLVITFTLRFRRRSPGQVPRVAQHGGMALELTWTVIPLIIVMTMFVWGARVYITWATPPEDALEVFGVGLQWMWKFQHPGGQREINTLHVPVGRNVRVTLTSQDVIHDFFVPDFRVHMDVIPGRYTTAWFQATKTGSYHLFCSEFCGTNHSAMIGKVLVMEPEAYEAWLAQGADDSLAVKGRRLFQKLQCVACHSADAKARAPVLENLYKQTVPLEDGTQVLADEAYLRESILFPKAKIVAGYRPIMPSFQGQVDEEELLQLIAFLKGLGPGQTPPRVENAPPPLAREGPSNDKKKEQGKAP